MRRLILIVIALGLGASALAYSPIEAVGLFKDRAMIRVHGTEHYLRVGETSPEGVRLLSANAAEAVVVYEGQQHRLSLTDRVGGSFAETTKTTISIAPDAVGQYRIRGAINGQLVGFLIDTGASVVAMSEPQAAALGIDYKASAEVGKVVTAQGEAKSFFVDLDSVSVGGVEGYNVKAAVIEGSYPVEVLLGMSYLRQVEMNESAGVLTLTAKY
jgi:aspartyl protease family protein